MYDLVASEKMSRKFFREHCITHEAWGRYILGRVMRRYLITIVIGIVLAAVFIADVGGMQAAQVGTGDAYSLTPDETVQGNLYAAGRSVLLSGTVTGDAVTAAQTVIMRGNVAGDVAAAGGTVDVLGNVDGDVRLAGGSVVVGSRVGGDVAVATGSLSILREATVGGDVLAVAGNTTVDGAVNGSVRIRGGRVYINGPVQGSVDVTTSDVVTLGRNATIDGDIVYRSPQAIRVDRGAVVRGRTVRENLPESFRDDWQQGARNFFATVSLIQLLAWLGAALAGVFLLPEVSRSLTEGAASHPWRALLVGLVFFMLVPVIVFLLFITLVGFLLGVLLLLFYFLFLIIAWIYSGVLLGAWIFRVYSKEKVWRVDWKSTLAGVLLLYIVSLIPVLGWLAMFGLFLLVLGELAEGSFDRVRTRTK